MLIFWLDVWEHDTLLCRDFISVIYFVTGNQQGCWERLAAQEREVAKMFSRHIVSNQTREWLNPKFSLVRVINFKHYIFLVNYEVLYDPLWQNSAQATERKWRNYCGVVHTMLKIFVIGCAPIKLCKATPFCSANGQTYDPGSVNLKKAVPWSDCELRHGFYYLF